jgi:DNA helicase HerA-like ATPase
LARQKYRVEPPLIRRDRTIELAASRLRPEDDRVFLGRLAESGPTKDVWMDLGREHVLAIVGKRGSGKSFTLGSFIEGQCTRLPDTPINHTSKTRAALLFDTLNIFQWMTAPVGAGASSSRQVQSQLDVLRDWGLNDRVELDVDLWVPAGFESRVTSGARRFQIRTWDMEVSDWAALLGVDAVQDIMGQLLAQVHDKVTRKGWTDSDGTSQRTRQQYSLEDFLSCLNGDPEIARDYARETIRAVRQRLSAYQSTELFGDMGTPLDQLVRAGRLSIFLLSGIPDDLRLVIVGLTIRQLLFSRAEASEARKTLDLGFAESEQERERVQKVLADAPPKTWVFIDEAQNIFPAEHKTSASDIFLRFVREGRNFGLSLGFTTQQPSAIDNRIMAQVDTLITHTLTVNKDLQTILTNLKSRQPDSIYLQSVKTSLADAIRQLAVGQAFVSSTDAPRGLFIDVRPRMSLHGGFEG